MREIKFRALESNSTNWIFGGGVIQFNDKCAILQKTDYGPAITLVQADSVGQFTGLHDKNNKPIFEGDILQDVYWGQQERAIGQVYWLKDRWVIGKSPKHKTWWEFNAIHNEPLEDDKEIIGNIYETPNLIETKE